MPESWIDLGLMMGSPPEQAKVVSFANWDKAPYQRWSFLHMRELVPTARVARGETVSPLPRDVRDLSGFPFRHRGRDHTLAGMMEETHVDGLMVVRDGIVVFEHYVDGMTPSTTHILQSVSKSLTATLTGVLVDQGRFELEATVPDHVEELGGTCWDGCSMQHLLDMRAGTAFDESDYEDESSESYLGFRILGWLPRLPDDPTPHDYVAQMQNDTEHGVRYEYRSILTDVLGWCVERATGRGLAELFSEEVWAPMGAAQDADFMVGPAGFPLADGGFCVTLQDLARFGLMYLQGGEIDGRQVVPAEWIRRLRVKDEELINAFSASPDADGLPKGAFYHDQWWVRDAEAGIYAGYGINGQQILVHQPSRTVIARLSSWPRPWIDEYAELADAGLLALCEWL
jgi:CubicO group peptidase (beta-lactamase class C family)